MTRQALRLQNRQNCMFIFVQLTQLIADTRSTTVVNQQKCAFYNYSSRFNFFFKYSCQYPRNGVQRVNHAHVPLLSVRRNVFQLPLGFPESLHSSTVLYNVYLERISCWLSWDNANSKAVTPLAPIVICCLLIYVTIKITCNNFTGLCRAAASRCPSCHRAQLLVMHMR